MDEHKLLKELTEGFSTQAKLSNQYWLFLMLASIISVANLDNINKKELIELPFQLGKVNFTDFNSFVLLLISASSIAFGSAFLQAQRTRMLVQRLIDSTPNDKKYIENIHIQDIFDSLVTPTFNRVAPIAQFLQGNSQFFSDKTPKKANRLFGTLIYVLLKIVTSIIVFIIPLIALYKNFALFYSSTIETTWGIPIFFYWFICLITVGVYLTMIISDIDFIYKVVVKLTKRK